MSAIIALYEIYKLLLKDNPQEHYNILFGEPIQVACVADTSTQAGETILAKTAALVKNCPWLLDKIHTDDVDKSTYMRFRTKADVRQDDKLFRERGLRSYTASVVLRGYSSNAGAARGRAIIVVVFDEIAHYQNREGRDNAYNLYQALTPSTTDFGSDGKIVCISSPKYEFGQFFDLYTSLWSGGKQNAIGVQIPSWEMYINSERIGRPPRFTFEGLKTDSETIEFGTPEWWREYGAKFQKNVSLYMNEKHIERMFKLADQYKWDWQGHWNPNTKSVDGGGVPLHYYHFHGDPAKNHAGFGMIVAHYDSETDKVFVDWGWRHKVRQRINEKPLDDREYLYPQNEIIDYESVEDQCKDLIRKFHLRTLSFDQWNSVGSIQRLKKFARKVGMGDTLKVKEETFTGPKNYRMYENLRTELANERVVCPRWMILSQELNNLIDNKGKIDKPDSGPVQTKDVADCLAVLVTRCLEDAEKGRKDRVEGQRGGSIGQMGGVPVRMPDPAIVRNHL